MPKSVSMFCAATLLSLGVIVGARTEVTASLTTAMFERPLVDEAMPVRTEHFVFENADGSVAGFAVWRRSEGRRGVVFEREMTFRIEDEPGSDPAIYHVEALEGSGSRLVQRETGPRGRAVLAELATKADVGLRAFEWGPCGSRQEVLARDETAALPLYLAELARTGRFVAGSVGLFDPATSSVVAIDVATDYATDGSSRRTNVWRRADGTLLLELTFVGVRLDGFRLQDGGPRARAVEAAEYMARGGSGAAPLAAASGNTGG